MSLPPPSAPANGGRAAPLQWQEGGQAHIDVRGLPAPQPLVAILRLVRSLPRGHVGDGASRPRSGLLYPELAELGWGAEPHRGRAPAKCGCCCGR